MGTAELALIGAVALIGPLASLSSRWRFPTVVLELLAGLILGVSLLGWLDATDPLFRFLADDIGFALVMFLAGTHVPLQSPALKSGLRSGALRAVLIGLASVPAGLGLASVFGTGHGLIYAVLFASSSSAVIMPMLADKDSSSPPVTSLIAQVAIADIVCIIALPLVIEPVETPRRLLGMLLVTGAAALVWMLLSSLKKRGIISTVHGVSKERLLAIELRVSLTLLFAVVALGQLEEISPMFSGFIMGLVVRAIGEPRRLTKQLFAVTEGFFGPLFFVWLGASINVTDALHRPSMLVLGVSLGLGTCIIHLLGMIVCQSLPLAALTAVQLGVPASIVAIGTSLGIFHEGEAAAILLGTLITLVIAAIAATQLPGYSKKHRDSL